MEKRKKVSEWLTDINNGLFNYITFDYLPFEPTQLNILYLTHSGNKLTSVLVERMDEDVEEIAEVVEHFFKRKWTKSFEMLTTNLPLIDGSRTETENITESIESGGTSESSGEVENLEDVVADNSSYTPSGKTTTNSGTTTESQGTESKEHERTLEVKFANSHLADIINKNLDVLEVNFLNDIVFKDIDTILTLKVYV